MHDTPLVNVMQDSLAANLCEMKTPVARLVDLTENYSGSEVAKLCARAFSLRVSVPNTEHASGEARLQAQRQAQWTPFSESHFLRALLLVRFVSACKLAGL